MKKIWIDCTNSPHVLFFESIIKELEKKYEIVVTARDYQQTIDLLKQKRIPFIQLGKHHGSTLFSKFFGYFYEVWLRIKFILKEKPDLTVCNHGMYASMTAFLTGYKRLYLFDGDGSTIQMSDILFANKSLCPEALPKKIFGKKLHKYPGFKEEVYLSSFEKDPTYLSKLGLKKKKTIFIRPEAASASYIKGENLMDNLIRDLEEEGYQIIIKGRTPEQIKYYQENFENLFVPTKTIDGPNALANSDLVISGGGTMNREAAVLGIPVISTFPNQPLSVDKWLVKRGFMKIITQPTLKDVKEALDIKKRYKMSDKSKRVILKTIEDMLS